MLPALSIHFSKIGENLKSENYAKGFTTVECATEKKLCEYVTKYVWSPAVYDFNYRTRDNFIQASFIGIDVDDVSHEYPLKEAINQLEGTWHIIGTTKSHQITKDNRKCDRYRIILKLTATTYSVWDYEYTLKELVKHYNGDQAAKDAARFFYPCKEIVSTCYDDITEEILVCPEELKYDYKQVINKVQNFKKVGLLPEFIERFIRHGILIDGNRNSTCFRIVIELMERGYQDETIFKTVWSSPFDKKAPHPFSEKELWSCIKSARKRQIRKVKM